MSHKQSLKQHKTAQKYRSSHVNAFEMKTCENNIVTYSFQIFWAKNFSANCPIHTVELNEVR